jgi:hypothetical protein
MGDIHRKRGDAEKKIYKKGRQVPAFNALRQSLTQLQVLPNSTGGLDQIHGVEVNARCTRV